jgi:hypothetical protein
LTTIFDLWSNLTTVIVYHFVPFVSQYIQFPKHVWKVKHLARFFKKLYVDEWTSFGKWELRIFL